MALWTAQQVGAARIFDPSDDGLLTITSGRVSEVRDQNGHGQAFTQATASHRPVIVANALNGKDVLYFDGSSRRMQFPVAIANTAAAKLTMYAVHRQISGVFGVLVSTRPAITAQGWSWRNNSTTEIVYSHIGHTGTTVAVGAGWKISSIHRNGLVISHGINGVIGSPTTFAGFTETTTPLFLGAENNGTGSFLNGEIARLIWIEDNVDQDTNDRIIGSLAHEFALTGLLDFGHPYKDAAPIIPSLFGTITDKDGNPAERRITVLDATGHCVATDTSDPITGVYNIEMQNDDPYTLVFDGEPDRNAQVFANVIPGEPPA